jgi:hypothetical protein
VTAEPFPEDDALHIRVPFEFYPHEVKYLPLLKISTAPQADETETFRQMARAAGISLDESRPRVILRFPSNPNDMLLSGMLVGGQA